MKAIPEIMCVGAAHVDRTARALGPVVLGSSNPVSVRTGFGGVARNVAVNLARLGRATGLAALVGSDPDGDGVLFDLVAAGVQTDWVSRRRDAATASYVAFLDPAGQLVAGLADMAIYDRFDAALLDPVLPALRQCPVWLLDCNLPVPALRHLIGARPPGGTLFVDGVSAAKAQRLARLLSGIDWLFVDRAEAASLGGADPGALVAAGVAHVVMTSGAAGATLATADAMLSLPAVPAAVRDATGAGDALIAGTMHAIAGGASPVAALRLGLAAAALTVESDGSVSPSLSDAALIRRASGEAS